MKLIPLVLSSIFVIFAAAIAQGTSLDVDTVDNLRNVRVLPGEGKSLIYLYRIDEGRDSTNISLDGLSIDQLSDNSFVVFEVPSGKHVFESAGDTVRSYGSTVGESRSISVKSGQIYYFENIVNSNPLSYAGRGYVSEFFSRDAKAWEKKKASLKLQGALSLNVDVSGNKSLAAKDKDWNTFRPTTPVTASTVANNKGIAVIIGSRNYSKLNKDLPDVDFAHNDADAIYQYVTSKLGFREENIILLKDATQSQLMSVFGSPSRPQGKLFKWVNPNKSDVFVYYSGHGVPGASDGRSYLLPVDADPTTVEINGLPLDTLYANLSQLPARSLTVVLDACFSGSSSGGAVFQNASSITLRTIDTTSLVPKGAVLTATGPNQVASWDKKARLGLFTRAFLEGVAGAADGQGFGNGDGVITLGEISSYIGEEVPYAARRAYGREQQPQVFGDLGQVLTRR